MLRSHFVRCIYSSEIINIVSELRYVNYSGISSKATLVFSLKCDLRRLQRLSLLNIGRSDALRFDKLDSLLFEKNLEVKLLKEL